MAETLRKVKSYENKSLNNVIDFAVYISTLEIEGDYGYGDGYYGGGFWVTIEKEELE